MSDAEIMQLYSRRILALTAQIPHLGRLAAPQGAASARSPQCGSNVSVELCQRDGVITEFAQEVRACALGQASAAILGAQMPGLSRAEIEAGLAALDAMLAGGAAPEGRFVGLEALAPARDFPNRHASIRLPWLATLDALKAAGA